jgi:hypothetical protein
MLLQDNKQWILEKLQIEELEILIIMRPHQVGADSFYQQITIKYQFSFFIYHFNLLVKK